MAWLVLICLVFCSGCQQEQRGVREQSQGSRQDGVIRMMRSLPTVREVSRWSLPKEVSDPDKEGTAGAYRRDGTPQEGIRIETIHYEIFTTLEDPLILRQVPVFLESAFRSYAAMLDTPIEMKGKLSVYLFDTRQQWEAFTRDLTGELAKLYLKIPAGAYTYRGICVAYHLGRTSDFSILAHEGWHQYSERLSQYRFPAWLNEGLATQFESFAWRDGRVVFSPGMNASRLVSLREALAGDGLMIGLEELLRLDAGRVVWHYGGVGDEAEGNKRIAGYYGQVYGLVRFLREGEMGRFRGRFRQMVNDGFTGRWELSKANQTEALQRKGNPTRGWNVKVGPMIFQQYFGTQERDMERAYEQFSRRAVLRLSGR